MNILITGGAGFIGSYIVEQLVNNGHNIIVIDNLSSGKIENIDKKVFEKITFHKINIVNRKSVYSVISKSDADAVIHLAALISVPLSIKNPAITDRVNVLGTINLAHSAYKCGIKKFIYISSCAVYGEAKYIPIDEEHPTHPINPYAVSKLSGELYLKNLSELYSLDVLILRLFNVYGPKQSSGLYGGVISKFITRALMNKPLIIYGDGEQYRDFIYVKDVANLLSILMEKINFKYNIYNVGTGRATTINELAELIKELTRSKNLKIIYRDPRAGDIRRSQASIKKLIEDYNFKPKTDIRSGLMETIKYFNF